MKRALKFIFFTLALTFLGNKVALGTNVKEAAPSKKEVLQAIKKAHSWLLSQQVPNQVVSNTTRKSFILSYKHDPANKGYKYIFSKSSLYDNALAIIAYTMVGNYKGAKELIDAFQKTSPDGHFYFNYNTHNNWPTDKDRHGAVTRNGASAWMGYAIAYYLKLKSIKDKDFKNSDEFKNVSTYLEKVIREILKFKITSKSDPRNGLIRGGYGQYKMELKSTGKDIEVVENFYDKPIEWVSIEHCMDLYFLLKEAVALGLEQFKSELSLYQNQLIPLFWNDKKMQFNRGFGEAGKDEVEALDAASWGAMYLYSIGDIERSLKALDKAAAYENWIDSAKGHRPYINVRVFEDAKINAHFYPNDANRSWEKLNISWYEGTFGVLLARLKIKGIDQKAQEQMTELLKKQNDDGSFVYATKKIPFQFSDRPSVASTAWFIIAASSYLVGDIRQSFWP